MNELDTSKDIIPQCPSIELKRAYLCFVKDVMPYISFQYTPTQAAAELIRLKQEGIISPENDPSGVNFERVATVLFACGDSLIPNLTNDRITLIINALFDSNVSNHLAQIIYNFMISPPASSQLR